MIDARCDVLLREMRDATRDALKFAGNASGEDFLADDLLQNAVAMTLVRVGEAATKISHDYPAFIDNHPETRWASMRGLRNAIAHAYHDVDFVILWRIVADHLPALLTQLDAILDAPGR